MDPLERGQAHLQPKGLLQLVKDMLLIDSTCINHSFKSHNRTMGHELGEGASVDTMSDVRLSKALLHVITDPSVF